MMQYKIFKHPSGSIESVKQGFSWPASNLTFAWALKEKMWSRGLSQGFIFLVYISILLFAPYTTPVGSLAIVFACVLQLIICTVFGVKGNSWREKNLVARGFEHVETVTAANSDGAMALYVAGSNMQSAAPAAQPHVSNRLQSAGHVG
jgi:hypothetical protein